MKKILMLAILGLVVSACDNAAPERTETVTNTSEQTNRVSETVASHSTEEKATAPADNTSVAPQSGGKKKWSRSGDPIDVSKYDAAIADAERKAKAAPDDAAAKKALGGAYFERAVALTEARQYASALGDFRKAIKNDPAHEEAKKNIDMITSIYSGMNIEAPAEGEEPEPLEFKKESK
ncbi:MAG: hypothetical protein R2684_14820 [Pyrinomonadaceae bacterium]